MMFFIQRSLFFAQKLMNSINRIPMVGAPEAELVRLMLTPPPFPLGRKTNIKSFTQGSSVQLLTIAQRILFCTKRNNYTSQPYCLLANSSSLTSPIRFTLKNNTCVTTLKLEEGKHGNSLNASSLKKQPQRRSETFSFLPCS